MPVVRKLVNQDYEDCQPLRVDHSSRYIVNKEDHWQMMFNLNSELTSGVSVVKIAAELDTVTLDKIRVVGYLWDYVKDAVNEAASCNFKVYKVGNPSWTETLVYSVAGVQQPNSYFLAEIDFSAIPTVNLDGETTLMIEAELIRLGKTSRDRFYINHLGIYDSFLRLKQDVEWLDISKLDE